MPDRRVHLICNAHLDPVWLWEWEEGVAATISTFRTAADLCEEFDEFVFNHNEVILYRWVEEYEPALFERIQRLVKAGKWHIMGGWYLQPDCNMPSGESFVRQILLGKAYFAEKFGVEPTTAVNFDPFGHTRGLAQILAKSGYHSYLFCRPGQGDCQLPSDQFIWVGFDGSEVMGCRNPSYNSPLGKAVEKVRAQLANPGSHWAGIVLWGVGNHGGGPSRKDLADLRALIDETTEANVMHSTPEAYFADLANDRASLPKHADDINPWAVGCYTSQVRIKQKHRLLENEIYSLEKMASAAALQGLMSYPAEELRSAAQDLAMCQFHDILPGSSIAEVNDEAIAEFAKLISEANDISAASTKAITGGGSGGVMLINSLSWDRSGEFELDCVPEGRAIAGAQCQWVAGPSGGRKLAVAGVELPALGGKALELAPGSPAQGSPFVVKGDTVETPFAVIGFDSAGRIASLVDKASGRQVAAGVLNGFASGEDVPQSWDNWDVDADQELKMRDENRLISREVVADGPLQLRIRSSYSIGLSSSVTQDIVFHSSTPRIDFETVIDWSEKHTLLKAMFDLAVHSDFARHEIQYGHVERPTHRNLPQDMARFEVACHKWMDLSDNGFGVAIINDCKYGVGVHGGRIGLSLIKSGTHPDARGDAGCHLVTYSILPHACGFSAESVVRPAYELNIPVRCFAAGEGACDIASLVTVDKANVIVESVKWAEDGRGFVVRLYEAEKSAGSANVTLGASVKSVSECNLLEENREPVALTGGAATLTFRALEIKTLYCEV